MKNLCKKIDLDKLKSELDYFFNYYGSEFKSGYGTEKILDCFYKYVKKGTWLDIGGGSSSLLWWSAQKYLNKITVIDISKESLLLSNLIRQSKDKLGCFKYVENIYGKKNFKNAKINFIVRDFFDCNNFKRKYINVSQIGLLGLCQNKFDFLLNLEKTLSLVKRRGVLIGANWIFNDNYSKEKCYANNYLTAGMIINFVKGKIDYSLQFCEKVNFKKDQKYKGVLIYVIKKIS